MTTPVMRACCLTPAILPPLFSHICGEVFSPASACRQFCLTGCSDWLCYMRRAGCIRISSKVSVISSRNHSWLADYDYKSTFIVHIDVQECVFIVSMLTMNTSVRHGGLPQCSRTSELLATGQNMIFSAVRCKDCISCGGKDTSIPRPLRSRALTVRAQAVKRHQPRQPVRVVATVGRNACPTGLSRLTSPEANSSIQ